MKGFLPISNLSSLTPSSLPPNIQLVEPDPELSTDPELSKEEGWEVLE